MTTRHLHDRSWFDDDALVYATLAELRESAPVHRDVDEDGRPYWIATRHAHVLEILANDQDFVSARGMRLGGRDESVAAAANSMLIVSDGERHRQLRRLFTRAMTPPVIRRLEDDIRGVVRTRLAGYLDAPDDFVSTVAAPLPALVVCSFLGIPATDAAHLGGLVTEGLESDDAFVRLEANSDLFLYLTELLEQRRGQPGLDYVSALLDLIATAPAESPTDDVTDIDLVMNLAGLMIGAIETTRHAMSGGVAALAAHPEQWELLRTSRASVETAVEEVLRWVSPGVHAMRTVTAPVSLAGQEMLPDDRVTVWLGAANRDPRAFTNPDTFDVDRRPNRHLTFGSGPHVCVGAQLARLEVRVLLDELLASVKDIRLLSPFRSTATNFTRGPRSLALAVDRASGGHTLPKGRT